MFIPVRSDRPLRTTPHVNYALIFINVVVFALTANLMANDYGHWVNKLMLWHDTEPANPNYQPLALWQFLTYQFLHADIMHLLGNMIFLWVFGNAVEDRLGKAGYLLFYLSMGVIAGMGHWLTSDNPVLGASGSVAGVTGAFLALFPRTRITFIYFFFLIGAFELPAMVVVIFYFVKDLLFYGIGGGQVAYTAHLAGNLAGFAVGMALLGPRLLPREPYDLFSLWTHKRRQSKFRKLSEQGYQPWEARARPGGGPTDQEPVLTEEEKRVLAARQAISRAISSHDMDNAARLYVELIDKHGDQSLSQGHQFDIANHLFAQGEHASAAKAYAQLMQTYPNHSERARVQLMLGLVYARYLGREADARPLLQEASQRLSGDDAALARQLLSEVG